MYNFESFIKPRGLLMAKNNSNDWSSVLDMSDNEFCQFLKVPLEEL